MFKNREEAGELLAGKLKRFKGTKDVLVLGLTRGGVVPASIIASRLRLPLDIIVIKKIGAPDNPELAIGAIGPKGTVYWSKKLIKELKVSKDNMWNLLSLKQEERQKQEETLRQGKSPKNIKDKTVILVDDGVATGASVICASMYLESQGAKIKILAVPVISKDTISNISKYFERVIALDTPEYFSAVGEFYKDFPQVENEKVKNLTA